MQLTFSQFSVRFPVQILILKILIKLPCPQLTFMCKQFSKDINIVQNSGGGGDPSLVLTLLAKRVKTKDGHEGEGRGLIMPEDEDPIKPW